MSVQTINLSWYVKSKKIVDEISLEINQGEILTILGPNGAGKSSFLKLIAGDSNPSDGEIKFDNILLSEISIQDRSFMRSVMSQSQEIAYDFSVKEIIEMGWIDRGISDYSKDFEEAVKKISIECSVADLLKQSFNTLSGGEKRRVHFARTLIQLWRPSGSDDPRYMFLDEPTANLDILHEQKMMRLIQNKRDEGIGILLILHDLNLAAKYSDRIAIFNEGKLVEIGAPEIVLNEKTLSNVYGLEMKIDENPFRINYY